MPGWYPDMLDAVSSRISTGRVRAAAAVNQELVATYWAIGKEILDRQSQEGWGAKVIDRLSADLRDKFPGLKGFSPRNFVYMRQFAYAWPDFPITQQAVAQLPWGHNIVLLEKLSDPETRLWYAAAAVEHGWSRNVLVHQIETHLHERSGQAISNFKDVLPAADSDLLHQTMKDPYIFDFVAMTDRHDEAELESQLVDHVEKFLLELGQGFAFVGRQVRRGRSNGPP